MFVLSDPAHQTLSDRQAGWGTPSERFCSVCGGSGMASQAIRLATTSPHSMIYVINTSLNSVKWNLAFFFLSFSLQ